MKDIVALGKNHAVDSKNFLENKNPIVILYELQGCPHCTAIESPWENAIKTLKNNKDVKDCVDCANAIYYYDKGVKAKGHKSRFDHLPEQLRGVSGFPTIHIINKGRIIEEYNGDRTETSIVEFVTGYVKKHPEIKKSPAVPAKPKTTPKNPKKPVQKI